MEKHYWMHRVSYMGGLDILKSESKLTIGFSDVRADSAACEAIENRNKEEFFRHYNRIYEGGIPRLKNGLWRFLVEMSIDDVVIVPCPWGFYICRVKSDAVATTREGLDLGWEREVEIVSGERCQPREDHARSALLSRMKCQQTNLAIDDLSDEVELAIERRMMNNPFNFSKELAGKCLELLHDNKGSDYLECLVQTYFQKLGAETEILPKNYSGKIGDCDVRAVFEHLNLTIFVQCKKHTGTTGDWSVQQIAEYAKNVQNGQSTNLCQSWVISTADGFTPEAEEAAKKNGVVLMNGLEFCRRAVNVGAFEA